MNGYFLGKLINQESGVSKTEETSNVQPDKLNGIDSISINNDNCLEIKAGGKTFIAKLLEVR